MKPDPINCWSIIFRSRNKLDGERCLFERDSSLLPLCFRTRADARAYIKRHLGYISRRPDLRNEPHGWLPPLPVRARLVLNEGDES